MPVNKMLVMPKLTKAAKEALLQKEFAERQARSAEQYLPKLMTVLEEATRSSDFELEVRNGQFVLRDRAAAHWDETRFSLSPVYSMDNEETLTDLSYELERKATERAEAQRRAAVKATALSKLTKEERDLLGL